MIYIEPTGGLCNRMRSINAAYHLSKLLKQKLTIVWYCTMGMTIPINKLFRVPGTKVIIVKFTYSSILEKKINRSHWRACSNKRSKCDKVMDEQEVYRISHPFIEKDALIKELSHYRNIWISGCEPIIESENADIFIPSKTVMKKKRLLQQNVKIGENTIGVHIRRTDHSITIKESPTDLFIEMIERELKENTNAAFYLATDSKEDEDRIISIFGENRISVFAGKDTSRDTYEGQLDAYVDLLMLTDCREIWGSYFSSFSEMAAIIGRKPFRCVRITDHNTAQ